jgi:hypothetical protein
LAASNEGFQSHELISTFDEIIAEIIESNRNFDFEGGIDIPISNRNKKILISLKCVKILTWISKYGTELGILMSESKFLCRNPNSDPKSKPKAKFRKIETS